MNPDPLAPTYELSLTSLGINPDQAVSVIFAVAFILWTIFTVISTYHWLRYGHRSSVAIPALITHVVISFFIAVFAVSGFIAQ